VDKSKLLFDVVATL